MSATAKGVRVSQLIIMMTTIAVVVVVAAAAAAAVIVVAVAVAGAGAGAAVNDKNWIGARYPSTPEFEERRAP